MIAILAFLAVFGCVPEKSTVDNIIVDATYAYPGAYDPVTKRVTIRRLNDESTLVHELYHSCQGWARVGTEQWYYNEAAAKRIERLWEEQ